MARKIPEASTVRTSLVSLAKAAGSGNGCCLLDSVDATSRAELLEIARGIIDGSIRSSRRRIVESLYAAGVPITRPKLETLIAKVRSGEVR